MYAEVDAEVHVHNMMESILGYKKDAFVVDKKYMYIITKSGQCHIQQTTLGWKLFGQCNNGIDKWIPLKCLKESNPV